MSADLAGLAARLSAAGIEVDRQQGFRDSAKRVLADEHLVTVNETWTLKVTADGRIFLAGTIDDRWWQALDAIKAWQSGPPAAAKPVAITEAEVEAGAKALFDIYDHDALFEDDEHVQDSYRKQSRAVLEAAESARRSQS